MTVEHEAIGQVTPVHTPKQVSADEIAKAWDCAKWDADMWRIVNLVTDNDDQMSTEQAVALGVLLTRRSSAGVKVKALEWEWEDFRSVWKAPSILGEYTVWTISGYTCFKRQEWDAGKGCGSSDADGFAAAQADFNTRILSALELPSHAGEDDGAKALGVDGKWDDYHKGIPVAAKLAAVKAYVAKAGSCQPAAMLAALQAAAPFLTTLAMSKLTRRERDPSGEPDALFKCSEGCGTFERQSCTERYGYLTCPRCKGRGTLRFTSTLASPSVPPQGETSDLADFIEREQVKAHAETRNRSRALAIVAGQPLNHPDPDNEGCRIIGWRVPYSDEVGIGTALLGLDYIRAALTPFPTLEPSEAEVERAARALCRETTLGYGWRSHSEADRADYVERNWKQHVDPARAALIASRQPTSGETE